MMSYLRRGVPKRTLENLSSIAKVVLDAFLDADDDGGQQSHERFSVTTYDVHYILRLLLAGETLYDTP